MATNLTGTWQNQGPDGGVYKLLQVGNVIFWRGQNTSAGWSNVGYGTIDKSGRFLSIAWGDPDGGNVGNSSSIYFEIVSENELKKLAGLGGGNFKRSG